VKPQQVFTSVDCWVRLRMNEPRTPLARPGQGKRSARTAGSGLRVVHRRLRHARSEGSKGAAGGVGGVLDNPLAPMLVAGLRCQKRGPAGLRRASYSVSGTGPGPWGTGGEGRGSHLPSANPAPAVGSVFALHSLQCSLAAVAGTKSRTQKSTRFLPKPLGDGAFRQRLRHLPQRAIRHKRGSKRNTDQAAHQIVTFCEGVASAWRILRNAQT
jgi:hypothetical protein